MSYIKQDGYSLYLEMNIFACLFMFNSLVKLPKANNMTTSSSHRNLRNRALSGLLTETVFKWPRNNIRNVQQPSGHIKCAIANETHDNFSGISFKPRILMQWWWGWLCFYPVQLYRQLWWIRLSLNIGYSLFIFWAT